MVWRSVVELSAVALVLLSLIASAVVWSAWIAAYLLESPERIQKKMGMIEYRDGSKMKITFGYDAMRVGLCLRTREQVNKN